MTGFHRSAEWSKFARVWRPRIAASLPAPCIRCGRDIEPGQAWDLGHLLDAVTHPELALDPTNVGPEHRNKTGQCVGNRSAGGSLGRRRQLARARRKTEMPRW